LFQHIQLRRFFLTKERMRVRYGTNSLTHDSHKQVTECEIWVSHGSIKVTVFWDMTLCSAITTSLTVDQTTRSHTSTFSNPCQHKFPISLYQQSM